MRVLQISSKFDGGGAERVALCLIHALEKKGAAVQGIGFYRPIVPSLPDLEWTLANRVQFIEKSHGADFSLYGRVREAIRRFRPDVIHCHTTVLKYVWPMTAFLGRIPIVHTIHNMAHQDAQGLTRLSNLVSFHLGRITVVGVAQAVAESVEKMYRIPHCHVIYNGVFPPRPTIGRLRWRSQEGISPSSVLFVWVGALRSPKNPVRLLEAFAEAFREDRRAELMFVGDGPLRPLLAARSRELNVDRRVHILGSRADVPNALAASDVFAYCSDVEGDPMAIKEAMCAGLPVVAPTVGGIGEVVEDGVTGHLYSPADVTRLRDLLVRTGSDEILRREMGDAARVIAASQFTADRMADEYLNLYERLASRQQSPVAEVTAVERKKNMQTLQEMHWKEGTDMPRTTTHKEGRPA
jgi:glycosyltransferase involved in cell wall biosynthesis